LVSRRWWRICSDKSLWQRLNIERVSAELYPPLECWNLYHYWIFYQWHCKDTNKERTYRRIYRDEGWFLIRRQALMVFKVFTWLAFIPMLLSVGQFAMTLFLLGCLFIICLGVARVTYQQRQTSDMLGMLLGCAAGVLLPTCTILVCAQLVFSLIDYHWSVIAIFTALLFVVKLLEIIELTFGRTLAKNAESRDPHGEALLHVLATFACYGMIYFCMAEAFTTSGMLATVLPTAAMFLLVSRRFIPLLQALKGVGTVVLLCCGSRIMTFLTYSCVRWLLPISATTPGGEALFSMHSLLSTVLLALLWSTYSVLTTNCEVVIQLWWDLNPYKVVFASFLCYISIGVLALIVGAYNIGIYLRC
jgi:hypothetical protein